MVRAHVFAAGRQAWLISVFATYGKDLGIGSGHSHV
jgi:hypothetical protein